MRTPWWGWECPPVRARARAVLILVATGSRYAARAAYDPLAQRGGRLVDGGQPRDLGGDALGRAPVRRLRRSAAARRRRACRPPTPASAMPAPSATTRVRVAQLIGEAGDDDGRDAGRERHPRRAGAAVADHRGGMRHHRRTAAPSARRGRWRARVPARSSSTSVPTVNSTRAGRSAERRDRGAEQRGELRQRRRDRAVGDVHERAVVAVPPVRQRPRRRDRLAEAQRVRGPAVVGVLHRLGITVRYGLREDPVAARVGPQAEPLAMAVEHRRDDRHAPGLGRVGHDPDPAVAHAEPLGGEQAGVLGRLAQDHVGPVVGDGAQDAGERRRARRCPRTPRASRARPAPRAGGSGSELEDRVELVLRAGRAAGGTAGGRARRCRGRRRARRRARRRRRTGTLGQTGRAGRCGRRPGSRS